MEDKGFEKKTIDPKAKKKVQRKANMIKGGAMAVPAICLLAVAILKKGLKKLISILLPFLHL